MLDKAIKKILGDTKAKVYHKSFSKLLRGALYLYKYSDPKYKRVLPYYDARPLIVLLEYNNTHFLGINVHYIPWTYRQQFLKKIVKKLEYKNRLKYIDIKRAAESVRMPETFAYFSIRKYIRSRIGSNLYRFDHTNYKKASQNIPPNFKKAQDSYIKKEINRKVRELRKQKKVNK